MFNTRQSPLGSPVATLRVFMKALLLALLLNSSFVIVGVDPLASLMRLNTWSLRGGSTRLMRRAMPIEALIAAHEVSRPKAPDEYRVIILGDSEQWGMSLPASETLTAHINARHFKVGERRLVAYNLAYPFPEATRDTLILDAAADTKPDLVIWFITAIAFNSSKVGMYEGNSILFELSQPRADRLIKTYDQQWLYQWIKHKDGLAITSQNAIPDWLGSLVEPFDGAPQEPVVPEAKRAIHESIPAQASWYNDFFLQMPDSAWQSLVIGRQITDRLGAKLLVVNEPMFISTGPNSDVNYNTWVQRSTYDKYRREIVAFTQQHNISYADLWNAIPPEHFTDSFFHADGEAWTAMVDRVISLIN